MVKTKCSKKYMKGGSSITRKKSKSATRLAKGVPKTQVAGARSRKRNPGPSNNQQKNAKEMRKFVNNVYYGRHRNNYHLNNRNRNHNRRESPEG